MAGSKKTKVLAVLRILLKKADRENPIGIAEVTEELEKLGFSAERKSVYDDFESLREAGFEIESVKSKGVGYYIANPPFTEDELCVIWDSVSCSEYVSAKKCGEIRKKIELISGDGAKKRLRERVYASSRPVGQSETVFENLTAVHSAVAKKKQISFYITSTTLGSRAKKQKYTVSPYVVSCVRGEYVLVAGCPELEGLNEFRVSRMERITILDSIATDVREFVGDIDFDILRYSEGLFGSYTKDVTEIKLKCSATVTDEIYSRFGKDVSVKPCDDGECDVVLQEEINEELVSWLFVRCNDIRVAEPKELIEALKNTAKDVYITYS